MIDREQDQIYWSCFLEYAARDSFEHKIKLFGFYHDVARVDHKELISKYSEFICRIDFVIDPFVIVYAIPFEANTRRILDYYV